MNDAPLREINAANATEHALLSRRSVRGYLATPVPRATVEHILDVAARAPSGTNIQPWRAIALTGAPLARFCAGVAETFLSGAEDGIERPYYPTPMPEPFLTRRRKIGWDLYGLLGIARGEKEKMRDQVVANLHYFGAPVGLIFVIDRRLEIGSWIDFGMFLQNICTAARGRGLDTCAMAVFAEFPRTIRGLLDISEDDVIVCGMALGYEDREAPANKLVTERVPAAEFTRFEGF
jgi:nitroreductase